MTTTGRSALLAEILLNAPAGQELLRRRKVAFDLLSESLHRRRVTADFELSEVWLDRASEHRVDRFPLPLSFLEKSPGRSFDYDLEVPGESVRMPTAAEIRADSRAVLAAAATSILGTLPSSGTDEAAALDFVLGVCVRTDLDDNDRIRCSALLQGLEVIIDGKLVALPAALSQHLRFRWLGTLLQDRGLVVVDITIPSSPQSLVVKFACIDSNNPDGKRTSMPSRPTGREHYRLRLRLATWPGAPAHVDVIAPPGTTLRKPSAFAKPWVTGSQQHFGVQRDPSLTRVHFYAPQLAIAPETYVNVDYSCANSSFLSGSLLLVLWAALATTACAVTALAEIDGGTAVAVMAIVPALAAPFLTLQHGADIVGAMLSRAKSDLVWSVTTSFAAGVWLSLSRVNPSELRGRDVAAWLGRRANDFGIDATAAGVWRALDQLYYWVWPLVTVWSWMLVTSLLLLRRDVHFVPERRATWFLLSIQLFLDGPRVAYRCIFGRGS